MTPGAKVQASIELLLLISKDLAPSDAIMNNYFRQRRYAGSSDRRLIRESVYTVMRNRLKLDWHLQKIRLLTNNSSRSHVITALVLIDRMNPQQISALFSGVKYSPIELDDNEKSYVLKLYGKPLLHDDMPRSVKFEYPDWMDHLVLESWGERLERKSMRSINLHLSTLELKL